MNKRSFFFGVLVGVLVTWALSFYLFYLLNSSQPPKLANLSKNIFNEEKVDNAIDNERPADGKSSYFKDKLMKEKRKISSKLLEELKPVTIAQAEQFGIIKSVEDQFVRDSGYKTHAFNVLVSNHIGHFRDIPDTRHAM